MDSEVEAVALSVEEVMKEEWEQMRAENSQLPTLPSRKRAVPFPDTTELESPRLKLPYVSSLCAEDDDFDVRI